MSSKTHVDFPRNGGAAEEHQMLFYGLRFHAPSPSPFPKYPVVTSDTGLLQSMLYTFIYLDSFWGCYCFVPLLAVHSSRRNVTGRLATRRWDEIRSGIEAE